MFKKKMKLYFRSIKNKNNEGNNLEGNNYKSLNIFVNIFSVYKT